MTAVRGQPSMRLTITRIGGPTAVIAMGGLRILVDPTFDEPQTYTLPGQPEMTKLTGLAILPSDLGPIDAALVSHDHHVDNLDFTGRQLAETLPLLLTTEEGAARLGRNATGLADHQQTVLHRPDGQTLTVTAVPAHHGPDGIWQLTGPVIGFVLAADDLPTVYISGDNSDVEVVRDIRKTCGPVDVAVLFAGAAAFEQVAGGALLTLGDAEVLEAATILEPAVIVPVHDNGWSHFSQGASSLRAAFEAVGLASRLLIPPLGVPVEIEAQHRGA